jgi:hypothetical protein
MDKLLRSCMALGNCVVSLSLFAGGIYVLDFPVFGLHVFYRLGVSLLLEFLALSVFSATVRLREAEKILFRNDIFNQTEDRVQNVRALSLSSRLPTPTATIHQTPASPQTFQA